MVSTPQPLSFVLAVAAAVLLLLGCSTDRLTTIQAYQQHRNQRKPLRKWGSSTRMQQVQQQGGPQPRRHQRRPSTATRITMSEVEEEIKHAVTYTSSNSNNGNQNGLYVYDDTAIVSFLTNQEPLDEKKQQQILEHHQQQEQEQEEPPKAPWEQLTELAFMGEIVEGKIVGFNKGGAIVRLFHARPTAGGTTTTTTKTNNYESRIMPGVKAFLPNSHLSDLRKQVHQRKVGDNDVPAEEEADYTDCRNDEECDLISMGSVLPMKIIDLDVETNKVVVSHREALKELLSVGDVVTGTVTALKPYGAFVEFKYADDSVGTMTQTGLIHKNHISHNGWKLQHSDAHIEPPGFVINECFRNDDLGEVPPGTLLLQVGSPVRCMIQEYDKYTGRIGLSTKALEVQPGDFLCDPQAVFDRADETAVVYQNRIHELEHFLTKNVHTAYTGEGHTSLLSDALLTAMNQQHPKPPLSQGGRPNKSRNDQQQRRDEPVSDHNDKKNDAHTITKQRRPFTTTNKYRP